MSLETEPQRGASPVERRVKADSFTAVAVTALVLLAIIVVTGGLVRLTGSGLGCSDWPNCRPGDFIDVSSTHSAIEQLNRLFTFLVGVGVLAAAVGAWRRTPRRRDLVVLGGVILAGIPAQGLIGAFVVWTKLHPAAVQLHFVLSMVLVWAAVMMVVRSMSDDPRPPVQRSTVMGVRAVGLLTMLAVLLGTVVTGSGPHAGDLEARRFFGTVDEIDVDALRWVTRIHSGAVWAAVLATVALATRLRRSTDLRRLEAPLTAWMAVAVGQGAIGYLQYATGLPAALVGLHLAGATALVAVTAWLWDTTSHAPGW